MSEYWVSRKKYYCKYCEIYIADDAPSRQQHENGLRHQGNKERFVRNLYKQGERKKKDLEEEKREMVRVEQAANAAFARDVSTGLVSASSTGAGPSKASISSAASSAKKPEKPSSPFANYSTAQSLGYTDPDAERLAAEAERRRSQGVVGDWEAVAPPPPPLPGARDETDDKNAVAEEMSKKRQADEGVDAVDDIRHFKVRKRTLAVGLGEFWDPGDIPIKLKTDGKNKTDKDAPNGAGVVSPKATDGGVKQALGENASGPLKDVETGSSKPKWMPTGWKRAMTGPGEGEVNKSASDQRVIDVTSQGSLSPQVGIESETVDVKPDPSTIHSQDAANSSSIKANPSPPEIADIKQEDDVKEPPFTPADAPREAPGGGIFRKRKIPAGNRGRR